MFVEEVETLSLHEHVLYQSTAYEVNDTDACCNAEHCIDAIHGDEQGNRVVVIRIVQDFFLCFDPRVYQTSLDSFTYLGCRLCCTRCQSWLAGFGLFAFDLLLMI